MGKFVNFNRPGLIMEQNALTQLENELVQVLKEEYSFYQTLYVLLDKQKDLLRYDKDESLIDLFTEIERCYLRIKKSEDRISNMKENHPRMFKLAAIAPDVRKVVNSIVTLVKKSQMIVSENEQYLNNRYNRIQDELQELQSSEKMMKHLNIDETSVKSVDETK